MKVNESKSVVKELMYKDKCDIIKYINCPEYGSLTFTFKEGKLISLVETKSIEV